MANITLKPGNSVSDAVRQLKSGEKITVSGQHTGSWTVTMPSGTTMEFEPTALLTGLLNIGGNNYKLINPRVTWKDGNSSTQHMVKIKGDGVLIQGGEIWGAKSYANVLLSSGLKNFVIERVYIHDTIASNSNNQDHNIYANNASDGEIRYCILANAPNGRNIKLGTQGSYEAPARIKVHHNVLVRGAGPSNLQLSYNAQDNDIYNNIFVESGNNGDAHSVTVYSQNRGGNKVHDNIVWKSKGAVEPSPHVTDVNNKVQDPKLTANYDYDAALKSAGYGHLADGNTPLPPPTPEPEPEPEPQPEPNPTDPCAALKAEVAELKATLQSVNESYASALADIAAARVEITQLQTTLSQYQEVTETLYRKA